MSVTIGTIAGSSGLGSERQVVQLTNGDLWAFGYTGTNTLATWVSQNGGTSWTASNTHTLTNVHNSEGRNLAVAYRNISGVDVIHVSLAHKYLTTGIALDAVRATISGTTITFHTLDTGIISVGTTDGASLFWAGSGIEIDTNDKVHIGNGWASSTGQGDICTADSTADTGTAEQMTPVTWTSSTPDTSPVNETRSGYMVDTGSGTVGLIADDGAGATTANGLSWYTWSSGAWSGSAGNQAVTGNISAGIDKNDWGAVAVSATDVHVVYRDSVGAYHHRRWNGSSWGAGQTVPTQTNQGGQGVALGTDGRSVWLCVLDNDASNTVRYIRWTSATFNGVADRWDSWLAAETSTATRGWIGCARDVFSQSLLIYWSEGSTLKGVAASAPTPADPPGSITRDAVSALGSTQNNPSFTITFTGAQPIPGDKICVSFWEFNTTTPSVTSVKDNATSQNTYTAGPVSTLANTQSDFHYWLDLPANATWSGNYTITVTFSISVSEADGGAIAYSGVQSGPPTSTNNNSGTSAAATTGAVNPGTNNNLYFGSLTDNSSNATATFTWAAPFIGRISQTNGSSQQAGSIGDVINVKGSQNGSITLEGSLSWNAAIMAWPATPAPFLVTGQAFGVIIGIEPPFMPLDGVTGLQAAFLQPFNPPLIPVVVAPSTVPATFPVIGPIRRNPIVKSRTRAISAAPPTPTFASSTPSRELRFQPKTKSQTRIVASAPPTPTFTSSSPVKELRFQPKTKSGTKIVVSAPPMTIFAAVSPLKELRFQPKTRAQTRIVVSALQTPTFNAVAPIKELRFQPKTRAQTRIVLAALQTPTFIAIAPARSERLSPASRSRTRITIGASVPGVPGIVRRGERLSPSTRSRTRFTVALPAAIPAIGPARNGRLSPASKSRSRFVVAIATIQPTVAATVGLKGERLSPVNRSRSRLFVIAAQVVATVAATSAIRSRKVLPATASRNRIIRPALLAPTFPALIARANRVSPASRSRTRMLAPAVPAFVPLVPTVVATRPLKAPIQPRPMRSRTRLFLAPVPPLPGVAALLTLQGHRGAVSRSRTRFLLASAPPPFGVAATLTRGRLPGLPTRSRSRLVAGIASGALGQVPTVTQEQIS